MRKNLIRIIAVAICSTVMFSSIGCSKKAVNNDEVITLEQAPTSNPVSDEPVTFTMLYSGEFNENYKSLEKMAELTNVTLDIQAVPDSDYDTKRNLLMNTDQMPDILTKTSANVELALNGKLLAISDYFDQMPNFMKFIKDNGLENLIENAKLADGKVYQLPMNTKEVRISSKQIFARVDVFEKNGLEVPKNYDELYENCKKLKEIYPDIYPIQVIYGMGNLLDMMAPSFGTSGGWGAGRNDFHYVEENDEWVYAPTSDEYKEMLMYLNKLYSEGLIDKEFTSMDGNLYSQKVSKGEAFVLMAEWLGCEMAANTAGKTIDPDFNLQPIYPLEGPSGEALVGRLSNSTQVAVIPASIKEKSYFSEFIRWIDWMYSDEGADLFSWGIEGETYEVVDGKKQYLSSVITPNNVNGTIDTQKEYGAANNCLTFVYPYDEEQARMIPEYEELHALEVENDCIPLPEPNLPISLDDIEEEKLYALTLSDYKDQMVEKFVMGGESFDNWDTFVNECESKGAAKLREMYNTAWKAQQ